MYFILFADDTNVFYSHTCLDTLYKKVYFVFTEVPMNEHKCNIILEDVQYTKLKFKINLFNLNQSNNSTHGILDPFKGVSRFKTYLK